MEADGHLVSELSDHSGSVLSLYDDGSFSIQQHRMGKVVSWASFDADPENLESIREWIDTLV